MSEPTKLGELVASALAQLAAWQATPKGQAAMARATRLESDRRRRELAEVADACGVPGDVGVRRFALEVALTGPLVDAVREALSWRAARSRELHGRAPVLRMLGGPVGRGKTVALAWSVVHHVRGARYVTATEIAATPRNGYSTNEDAHRRWERVDLLCVDEVGMDAQTDALVGLMLARWTAGGATLLAGNLNRREFTARYLSGPLGERLTDRVSGVQKRGGCDWFVLSSGPSLRGAEGAK